MNPHGTNEPSRDRSSGCDDDWAIAGLRLRGALEAVEAGGLRLCRTAVGEDPYLSDGTGLRPKPLAETVQRMLADGLLHQDSSENPYRAGQLLSLTPQGEAVLREARTAAPRVSAALSRSNAPAEPRPPRRFGRAARHHGGRQALPFPLTPS